MLEDKKEKTLKYYQPKIEEFYVGFEFEFQGMDCNWFLTGWSKETVNISDKDYFGLYTLEHIQKVLKGDTPERYLRVKYLDREDIESLGFEFLTFGDYGELIFTKKVEWAINHPTIIKIDVSHNSCKLRIQKKLQGGMDDRYYTEFEGVIKNKSELKRILKQLNIKQLNKEDDE